MTFTQQAITILAVILGTMATRFIPFLIFSSHRPLPEYIKYLGKLLPSALFGLLVVFSLKNTSVLSGNHGIPELVSVLTVILIHLWKRQMILSVAAGTFVHMLLVQLVF